MNNDKRQDRYAGDELVQLEVGTTYNVGELKENHFVVVAIPGGKFVSIDGHFHHYVGRPTNGTPLGKSLTEKLELNIIREDARQRCHKRPFYLIHRHK